MRIGLYPGLSRRFTFNQLVASIVQAEQDGFASVWVPGFPLGVDALTVLTVAGTQTKRTELGAGIVATYPRHPITLAQQALTIQSAVGNRLSLGIGLSHRPVIEGRFGLDFSKPIRHMREYLTILTGLLNGEPIKFQGEEYRINAQFHMPGVKPPPVFVAALGEQMLKLAGRLAAGAMIWMGGVKYLSEMAVPTITQAASVSGRPAPRILAGFPIAVTELRDAARQSASKEFAVYAQVPAYRAALDKEGAADAADVAVIGTESEVEAQMRRLADAGVTDFLAAPYVVSDDPDALERSYRLMAEMARVAQPSADGGNQAPIEITGFVPGV